LGMYLVLCFVLLVSCPWYLVAGIASTVSCGLPLVRCFVACFLSQVACVVSLVL
jgi:hypothetical protein